MTEAAGSSPSIDFVDLTKHSAERGSKRAARERTHAKRKPRAAINVDEINSPIVLDDSVRNESVIELLSDDDGPTQPVDLITSNSQPLDLTTPTKRRRRTTAIQQSRFPAGVPPAGTNDDVLISVTSPDISSDDIIVIEKNQPTPSAPAPPANEDTLTPNRKLFSCPICMDHERTIRRTGRHTVSTNCGHIFCNDCLTKSLALNRLCPTCRKKLTKKQFHPIFL